MGNWMEKFENGKDKTLEEILNNQLNPLLELVDNSREYREKDMEKTLAHIVELYEKLHRYGCDFDEKDMILRKKQLAELRFKMKKREYMETKEAGSWNEFQEEEQEVDDEER